MSRIKLLLDVVTDLRSLADSVQAMADAIASGDVPDAARNEPEVVASTKPPPAVTLEQVRAALSIKSQEGYTADVRALLQKHGAEKLSAIDPSHYAALLADAEALGHG